MGYKKDYIRKRIIPVLVIIILLLLVVHLSSDETSNRAAFFQIGIGEGNIKVFSQIINYLENAMASPMLVYEDVGNLEHFEVGFANETYETIKDSYHEIDFFGEFETGDKENYKFYLEKFHLLLEEKVRFTISETRNKADMTGKEEFYLSEYGELDTHSTELPFVPEDYLYYFFDMSRDGIPDLCITSKDYGNRFVYIFQYKKETDEIILWHELSTSYFNLIGTGKMAYTNQGLASGFYNMFYQLDAEGNRLCEVSFHCIFKKEVVLYMVGVPEYTDKNRNYEIKKGITEMPYQIKDRQGTYYRVSEEQFEELTKDFFEAQKLAGENLQEVTYTYQELLALQQEEAEEINVSVNPYFPYQGEMVLCADGEYYDDDMELVEGDVTAKISFIKAYDNGSVYKFSIDSLGYYMDYRTNIYYIDEDKNRITYHTSGGVSEDNYYIYEYVDGDFREKYLQVLLEEEEVVWKYYEEGRLIQELYLFNGEGGKNTYLFRHLQTGQIEEGSWEGKGYDYYKLGKVFFSEFDFYYMG